MAHNVIIGQFERVPMINASLQGQTLIITGANSGLGYQAAKQAYELGCSRLILACRSLDRGNSASDEIKRSSKQRQSTTTSQHAQSIEVWQLDMCSYASVKSFAARAETLDRLDSVVLNAGVDLTEFKLAEGLEETITVNVTSTFLLAVLLLPQLRKTATMSHTMTHLSIVSSSVHFIADDRSLSSAPKGSILSSLSDEKTAVMPQRYFLSKLMVILCLRQFARQVTDTTVPGNKDSGVIVNTSNPGYCRTELFRHENAKGNFAGRVALRVIGRSAEVGARTLIHAVLAPKESHGQYMGEGRIKQVSAWVQSAEGEAIGKDLWNEVLAVCESAAPGCSQMI